ncbi:FtsQ-type POTRA domain-containing protein [Pontimonas sp.]|uniref:FtsQ-type POTRA domain-containing protein n=1 Tax=Pontimonas sp. TaxID=2304492 RepID=UPI00287070F1|nr:FtsQ-type POTRA domain-containing protein [Pontimonas sp.]MDR9433891.1 FtsQ-type POTRA domain-containing protein [Pontimonas sp.]
MASVSRRAKKASGATRQKPSGARAERRAARERKRAERREYRRFTTATRQRRLALTAGIGGVVLVAILTIVVTSSPLLGLKTIRVLGTERLSNDTVVSALQPFGGEPLARVSPADVAASLSDIALIASVETRIELPSTLVVTVVERTPIGAVSTPEGFAVVDRAAVTLFESETQPSEFPLIGVPADPQSRGFVAIGEALSVIPPEVLSRIERVSASSADTVAFSLRDSQHRVLWGSSELSRDKARVLPAALRTAGRDAPQLIDLSTPDTVVIRDAASPFPTPSPPAQPGDDSEAPSENEESSENKE